MKRLLPLVLLLGTSGMAFAANYAYVDDQIKVSLRSATGDVFQYVSTVEAGTRVEVLEAGTDFVRVRDPKGKEGWLKASLLTRTPPARDRLVVAEKKLAALDADKQNLREQLAQLQSVQKEKDRLEKELNTLKETAAAPLKLSSENKAMRDTIRSLTTERDGLLAQNQSLKGEGQRQWFVTGAAVLAGGILIGLIAPRFKRRKSGWSSDF